MFDLNRLKSTYFKMALPVVIGLVITLIYNIVDVYFIALTKNDALIAGVGYCGPLFTLLMAFGNIFGQGGSSVVSRLLGANDTKDLKKISSFCFYFSIIVGLIVMLIMLVFQNAFLKLLGASGDNLSHARDYYIWLGIGAPAIISSFVHGNLIRCEGHAKEAMIGHIVGTIINIVLDPILILGFKMGAAGAAIATITGYAVSTVYFFFSAKRISKHIGLNPKDMICEGKYVGQIVGIGMTSAITNIMQTVSCIILNRFLTPYGGDPTIAAMSVMLKVALIAQLVLSGFSFGALPVYGYLFGSKNLAKLKELTKFFVVFLTGVGLFITVLLGCLATPVAGVFFDDASTIQTAANMLRWQLVGTVFMALIMVFTVLFQASGKVIPAFIMSISRQGVVFIAAIIILNATAGYTGVLATQAVADFVSFLIGLLCLLTFKSAFKKTSDTTIEEVVE